MKNPFNHDAPPSDTPLVNVQVDGVWMQFPKGLNAVEAARRAGKFVPHYCYHPKLSIAGNCRMCLIETGAPKMDASRAPVLSADGHPEINWTPRPAIGCATQVSEGMAFRTESKLIDECRRGVMEFLLINHPLDCPICDQAGECKLQEYSVQYGNDHSRFTEEKVKKPKRVDIGERIVLDDERCIMCSRCIRFSKDTIHDDVLGFTERGSHTTLAVHPDKRFDNNYSLNTVDICPVGALTSKDFRFQMRVWFLKETKSFCTNCATGCNTIIGSREEHRLSHDAARERGGEQSQWMCDQGRLGFHYIHSPSRLTQPVSSRPGPGAQDTHGVDGDHLPATRRALAQFKPEQIAIVASGRMTNEEAFLLKLKSAASLGGDAVLTDYRSLASARPTASCAAPILIPTAVGHCAFRPFPRGSQKLAAIRAGIDSGNDPRADSSCTRIVVHRGCRLGHGALLQKLESPRRSLACSKARPRDVADFILTRRQLRGKARLHDQRRWPAATPEQARSPFPVSRMDDWQILLHLKEALGGGNGLHTIEEVFKAMAETPARPSPG